ncbi:SatD family protein [Nocardioides sp. BP30]|uniref:SatD family protein n=1 Tax=Nocardioides sp. BP30 TaxID=3036374 RepID=UPI0024688C22|nr:SatD family protein [Nocardioides sp. BP30]WGL50689.1 SatD family protein [Nocardioides sp. BP30]
MVERATVIGDVVGSRGASDRDSLHRVLLATLDRVNRELGVVTPLRVTVGDEYQGVFAGVGAAIAATLRLRLLLAPDVDVRHGIGWGEIRTLSDEPRVEDGPGWWAAREAIERVARLQREPARSRLRTAYVPAPDSAAPDRAAIDAALAARDELLGRLDAVSLSVLDGMLRDMSQREIAHDLGISPSAVSQRVRRDGLAVLIDIDSSLGTVR